MTPSCCERLRPYIAAEGAKGAGKSTALAAVRQALRQTGVRVASLDPTARGFALHPLELLHRSAVSRADGVVERVYAYRSNRQARLLCSSPETFDLVLGDRSFVTTLATRWDRTQTIGERAHFDWCRRLEWAIPVPDHVVYIDVPIAELRRRVELRGRRYGTRDECLEKLSEVQDAYAAIRRSQLPELRGIRWHRVSGEGSTDRVAAAVIRTVLTILSYEKQRNAAGMR